MNIMLAVTNISIGNGGVSTHIIDMCRELIKRKHTVVLVTDPHNCDYIKDIEEMFKNGRGTYVPVEMTNFQSSPMRLLRVTKEFIRIARQEKIDIAHMHSQSLCVVGAMMKIATGIPYIWTNHIDEIWKPKLFKRILQILHFPIISASTDLKEMLVKEYGVSAERISVVNNGANLDNFLPLSAKEKDELLDQFHVNGKYVIGLLARMSYGKGHIYLLEAVKKLQFEQKLSNLKILIAGKAHDNEVNYRDSLAVYAKKNALDVEFVGFQNPRKFFGICDISVLPSIFEGFALTVIESLAMGCPVIRSDTPGWSDMKDVTFVFHKKCSNELAQHLLYAYTHQSEMREMGIRGENAVKERFTIENQVDQTIAVYGKYLK